MLDTTSARPRVSILPLLGGLILLFSWIAQSILYQYWSSRQSSLQHAESVYLTFLSTSYVMNAMKETRWNAANFRMGLYSMAAGLPQKYQDRWADTLAKTKDEELNIVGEKLMRDVSSEQKAIEHYSGLFRWLFIASYMVGSLLIIIAERLKARGKA